MSCRPRVWCVWPRGEGRLLGLDMTKTNSEINSLCLYPLEPT